MTNRRRLSVLVILAALTLTPAAAQRAPIDPGTPAGAYARLRAAQPGLIARAAPATGAFGSVRAPAGDVLVADDSAAGARGRALRFLSSHGAIFGMSEAERARPRSAFAVHAISTDPITGVTHVRLDQRHDGLPVFGAQLVVHMTSRGITGAHGVFVPRIDVSSDPVVGTSAAAARAMRAVARETGVRALELGDTSLRLYHDGLIAGRPGSTRLAWAVDVAGAAISDQVWIDAVTGGTLNTIERIHAARDRCVYTPRYDPADNEAFRVRKEGDPPTLVPMVDNLYDFSGYAYDFYANTFGRDSFDGAGAKMRTVYEVGTACPNAYWNGGETHYCPGFDVDDVVLHEWTHAFTQYTHGLIYQNQPGALNEAYSDIFGETLDLIDDWDGIGGTNNEQPYPDGVRWLVGEDLTEPVADALGLRDMWDPERVGQPAKVSSPSYICGEGDGGGVHTNSQVPNHTYAILVDGKTVNGHTVEGIGLTKAAHIYYQAMVGYQTPTTGFSEHAEALQAACADLLGVDLPELLTGAPSGKVIGAGDCAQVDEAIEATEMFDPPVACGGPLLEPGAPPVCAGATTLLTEDFSDGLAGWELTSEGSDEARWPGYTWATAPGPDGLAAFADNTGTRSGCPASGPNHAGRFGITSAPVTVPAGPGNVRVRFDHKVATDPLDDGGNVSILINDAETFEPLPETAYTFNAPNGQLRSNTTNVTWSDPKSGERAWTGGDTGVLTGSWGTSIADLAGIVAAGDTFRLRFELGQDCAVGADGWYVDDVLITLCPPAPALALEPDYGDPDTDGSYTLAWDRPAGASGPDVLQEAQISAIFSDDASTLELWDVSTTGDALGWELTNEKPAHTSQAFGVRSHQASLAGASLMTLKTPIAVPATGDVALTFKEWGHTGGDLGAAEVSNDGGASWRAVWKATSAALASGDLAAFATAPLTQRSVDLKRYRGDSVLVRFKLVHAAPIYIGAIRMGWYVDDIRLEHTSWADLLSTASTSAGVTRTSGTYLYRVRTTFGTDAGDWSNVVVAKVS